MQLIKIYSLTVLTCKLSAVMSAIFCRS